MSDWHSWKKYQTSKPVMVSCEFNSHWRQFYLLLEPFKTLSFVHFLQKCQILVIGEKYLITDRSCNLGSNKLMNKNCLGFTNTVGWTYSW